MPIITIPIAVLLAFIPMYLLGVTANIMSLSGIAISIGVLVDGAIVEVENAYKKLELWQEGGRVGDFHEVRLRALKEVGPSVFFSLLVIAVAFIPIFALEEQEGRLFKPLAYTKNLHDGHRRAPGGHARPGRADALRADGLGPFPAEWPISWLLEPDHRRAILPRGEAPDQPRPLPAVRAPVPVRHPAPRRDRGRRGPAGAADDPGLSAASGSEFMPPLWEGDLLYMPTTLPGLSVTEAQRLMQRMDEVLMTVPEVERVFGKAGRAETSTDPAPFSMMETTILLKPPAQWRHKERWYSNWPRWMQAPFRAICAGPHQQGGTDRGPEREDAVPRRGQRLDDADQDAH